MNYELLFMAILWQQEITKLIIKFIKYLSIQQ